MKPSWDLDRLQEELETAVAAVFLLDVSVLRVNKQNLDCQDILLLQYLEDGGKENLDKASDLSLEPERWPDEVVWELT